MMHSDHSMNSGRRPSGRLVTTAIVVTYKRPQMLATTLARVAQQSLPAERVLVVDNDADDEIRQIVDGCGLAVADYLATRSNLGPGGGFALGLEYAEAGGGADWYWLLDDDSPPSPESLEAALAVATTVTAPVGAVALRGGHIVRGRIRHDLKLGASDSIVSADFVLVDGSLVAGAAVRAAGYPRSDFFIMMEDLEFSIRLREIGFALLVRPTDGSENFYRGSGSPWRGYYQARNHLRLAIERRSAAWIWGWCVRELGILLVHLRHRRWGAIGYRVRGAIDGVRSRMGRRVEPIAGPGRSEP